MNKTGPFFVGLLLGILVLVGVCFIWWQYYADAWYEQRLSSDPISSTANKYTEQQSNPLFYDIGEVWASVEIGQEVTSTMFSGEILESQAKECQSSAADGLGYWGDLADTLAGGNQNSFYEYKFTYQGESQEPTNWIVSLVPNAPGYTSMEEFGENFGICSVGGAYYPYRLNDQWLMFTSSCGSGYDDGSGLPNGCDEIKTALTKPGHLEFR